MVDSRMTTFYARLSFAWLMVAASQACGTSNSSRRLQSSDTTTTTTCGRDIDLLFVLDESGSIGARDYGFAKLFVNASLEAFPIGLSRTRVGVVRYSTAAFVASPLNASTTYCDVAGRVNTMGYAAGGTGTFKGLELARAEFRAGARPKSAGIPRVMIVVTDGNSNGCNGQCCPTAAYAPCNCNSTACSTKAVQMNADAARSEGITVMAITVGAAANSGGNPGEFTALVGGDDSLRFPLANYSQLMGAIIRRISAIACTQPARVDTSDVINATISGNNSMYFAYNSSGPLNLNLTVTSGGINLCISYSNRNPTTGLNGSNDGCAGVGDPSGGTVITAYPPPGSNGTIFVVCEGSGADGNASSFLLSAGTCGHVRANVTANGTMSANNATTYYVGLASPSPAATPQPRCFSCPADQVLLAATGPYAGVCSDRCATDRQWTWPYGRRLCFDCDASCFACGPSGGPRDCRSCNNGSVLLPNAVDPSLPATQRSYYDAAAGRCIPVGSCPAGTLPTEFSYAGRYTEACQPPSSSATPTASGSSRPTGSASGTATVSISTSASATATASVTPSISSTASVTASLTASASITPSSSPSASFDPSSSKSPYPLAAAPIAGCGTSATACNGHGSCRQVPSGAGNNATVAACVCYPGYTGTFCDQCVDGYYRSAMCGRNGVNCGRPCKNIIDEDTLCYSFLAGSNDCPAYMRRCNETSGFYQAFLTCSACPGTVIDPRTGQVVPGSTCSGHGTCSMTGSGLCQCDAGWQGAYCSQPVPAAPASDPCAGILCNGRGICANGVCACQLGWYGANCTYYLLSNSSSGTGSGAVRRLSGGSSPSSSSQRVIARPLRPGESPDDDEESGGAGGGSGVTSASSAVASQYAWWTGPWHKCTSFCGGNGTMIREVTCRRLVAVGAETASIRGDGSLSLPPQASANNSSSSSSGGLGSAGAGSEYSLHPQASVANSLCDAATKPEAARACNRYACPASYLANITRASSSNSNTSALPAAPPGHGAVLLFLNFPSLLLSSRLSSGSPARQAVLDGIHADVTSLLQRLGYATSVNISLTTYSGQFFNSSSGLPFDGRFFSSGENGISNSVLQLSLVPWSMVWVDFEGNGTRVMIQILSAAAVRAQHNATSGSGSDRARLLQQSSGADVPASDAAGAVEAAVTSDPPASSTDGLVWLLQADDVTWTPMMPDNVPGYDPARLLRRQSAPAAASNWQSDPKSVGGLAAGCVSAVLVAAALLFIARKRNTERMRSRDPFKAPPPVVVAATAVAPVGVSNKAARQPAVSEFYKDPPPLAVPAASAMDATIGGNGSPDSFVLSNPGAGAGRTRMARAQFAPEAVKGGGSMRRLFGTLSTRNPTGVATAAAAANAAAAAESTAGGGGRKPPTMLRDVGKRLSATFISMRRLQPSGGGGHAAPSSSFSTSVGSSAGNAQQTQPSTRSDVATAAARANEGH